MLKSMRIGNFKTWSDTGEIKFAPITIFFGSNSSGKSSLGQFLVLLKQTVANSDRKSILTLNSRDKLIDFGTPSDIIFDHNIQNKLSFSYTWKLDSELCFEDSITQIKYNFDEISFAANINIVGEDFLTFEVDSYKYTMYPEATSDGKNVELSLKKTNSTGDRSYILKSDGYKLVKTRGRSWNLSAPVRFYGFPNEAVSYYKNAEFLQKINLYHEDLFSALNYLGPIRKEAKRTYEWSGNEPENVGIDGGNFISAILSAKNQGRELNFAFKTKKRSFQEIIALSLQKMGLVEELKIEKITKDRQEYTVKVRVRKNSPWVDIADVGFGISQVLPVVTQLFFAPKGSIIIIEQPEIHLHPSAQAGLADVIIDAIKARENGDRSIQLIIETHSEHFLRRLPRRLAESQITDSDIVAYFANAESYPTKLEKLNVDEYGNIHNWPKDFFGDITSDLFSQAESVMKRRMGEDL